MNKYSNKTTTLDNKHTELLKKFKNNDQNIIPKYKSDIERLEIGLIKIKTKNTKTKMDKIDSLNTQILTLKNNIYKLEKERNEYFLNNAKYIFDYFEEKKSINDCINIAESNIASLHSNTGSGLSPVIDTSITNKKITQFFSIESIHNDNKSHDKPIRADNISKYFYNINNSIANYDNYCFQSDICRFCSKGEMVYVESEGICICNNCSKTVKYLIENEKPSYKEPPKEVCFYAYKRINHLREILAQFQAKESTHIPNEVYENIKNQIKKERIEIKDLTNKKTKEILKNLGYNKFYEHIPYIKDKLGIKPPIMSQELEETLCNLFLEIQKPYSKYCPIDRVNFLNYYYTLYKLCELLGERRFLPYFPMLKDREKRIEQDEIWKKICGDLGWKFIATI